MAIAVVLFVCTLTLVIWQPRGLGVGWSAMGGAVVALAAGVITPSDIPAVWHIVWDASFTLVGLILISLVLDAAGFFEWAALHVVRLGGGRGHRLFVLVLLLGALTSAVFANDGAVLILTPLVIEMLHALKFNKASMTAFIMATGFVCDTTSLPFKISNLVNILTANYFGISFTQYASVMMAVNLVALAATLGVLWLFYRRHLPARFDASALAPPRTAIRDPFVFYAGWAVLAGLACGYLAESHLRLPTSVIVGTGAVLLIAAASRAHWLPQQPRSVIPLATLIREAPWQVVVFSLAMYCVVYGLRNEGLTRMIARVLDHLGRHGIYLGALGAGGLFAALSAVMNNLPAVLLGNLAIHDAAALSPPMRTAMTYANVVGCDLGPKMTPIGSLATLLWLHVLRRRGLNVSWGEYFRTGVVLTLPVLGATLLGLAAWLEVVR